MTFPDRAHPLRQQRQIALKDSPLVTLYTAAATCLLLWICHAALWLVMPLLLSLVLYYLLVPLHRSLVRLGLGRASAAALSIGIFGFGLALACGATLSLLESSLLRNAANLESYVSRVLSSLERLNNILDIQLGHVLFANLAARLHYEVQNYPGQIAEYYGTVLEALSIWLPALALVPFVSFFMLKDSRELRQLLVQIVPNAFFESSLVLLFGVDTAARAYFRGLFRLTLLDGAALTVALAWIGLPEAGLIGFASAILMWIPYLGNILACAIASLIAILSFPERNDALYYTVAAFLIVRWLDALVFLPLTIGKSLRIHPLIAVLTIVLGGAIAGIPGMVMALPLFGILNVMLETLSAVFLDERLMARYRHERSLRLAAAQAGLSNPHCS